jgi:hypothetical protein
MLQSHLRRSINSSPTKRHFLPPIFFSTSLRLLRKPIRPEPTGEVKAHFLQKQETQHFQEDGKEYTTRWKRYLDDLGSSAAPERLGGRDFGSRVRGRQDKQRVEHKVIRPGVKRQDAGK